MKPFIEKIIRKIYSLFRPLLGYSDVCIYPISCSDYAFYKIKTVPMYKSVPSILIRLISCNPLWALLRAGYFRLRWK